MQIMYEVVMRKGIRIWNGFFETLADAERIYHEYVALDWSGDDTWVRSFVPGDES
jgi:hypothetical protein